ncbi:MAG TPA: SIS domain-containing protein [Blastocatellia bacterium]|nr:SIS domain-containing protein [Blastocatellia bacterium]
MAREREHSSIDRPISTQSSYAAEQAPDSNPRPEPAPTPLSGSTNGKEATVTRTNHTEQSAAIHSPDQQPDSMGEIEAFLDLALKELSALRTRSEEDALNQAANLILEREAQGGRVHVTGVGKSEYVARYIASLLSSTGTPGYFLHATECVHGSAGQLCRSDVAIAISNSGSTPELMSAVEVLKELEIKIIGVSGNPNSALADASDVFLYAGVANEGGALNLAPRTSILAENLVLCALSVALEARKGLTREQYARWHPGGVIGKLARGD